MSKTYEVHDKSLLAEPFKRWLWLPLLARVPLSLSANSMTLGGTALNMLAAAIAILVAPSRLSTALISVLIFAYLCIDNMDGAQARRTGTSSPLGEFLDHWLDGMNGTLLSLGAVVSWGAMDLRGMMAIAATGLAYSLTMWEQRWTGRAHFGRLGNIEGIFGVSLMFALQSGLGNELFCKRPLVLGQSLSDLFVWLSLVASSLTALGPVLRVGRLSNLPAILLGYALPIVWYALHSLPFVPAALLLVGLTPLLGGRMIVARLNPASKAGPEKWLLLPLALSVVGSLWLEPSPYVERRLVYALAVWCAMLIGMDFRNTVRHFAGYIKKDEWLSYLFGLRRPQ